MPTIKLKNKKLMTGMAIVSIPNIFTPKISYRSAHPFIVYHVLLAPKSVPKIRKVSLSLQLKAGLTLDINRALVRG